MRWLKRSVQVAGGAVCVVLIALAVCVALLRLDKENVFYEMRGTYQDAVTLDTWESAHSQTRLLRLRNGDLYAPADVYVRRPAELDSDYRILLMYAGAKTKDRILRLIPDRSDLVLVSVQYPYASPDGFMEHLRWPYDVREAVFRTVAAGMLAVSHLQQEEDLDIERVAVVGVSLGVPFATLHGALDARVPTVMLVHGGGDIAGQVRATHEPRWLATPASLLAANLFYSFEPLRYVDRIAPRQLIIVAARNETMIPVETVEKLYAKAGEPKLLVWTESDHVRSRSADVIEQIIEQIDRYLHTSLPPT